MILKEKFGNNQKISDIDSGSFKTIMNDDGVCVQEITSFDFSFLPMESVQSNLTFSINRSISFPPWYGGLSNAEITIFNNSVAEKASDNSKVSNQIYTAMISNQPIYTVLTIPRTGFKSKDSLSVKIKITKFSNYSNPINGKPISIKVPDSQGSGLDNNSKLPKPILIPFNSPSMAEASKIDYVTPELTEKINAIYSQTGQNTGESQLNAVQLFSLDKVGNVITRQRFLEKDKLFIDSSTGEANFIKSSICVKLNYESLKSENRNLTDWMMSYINTRKSSNSKTISMADLNIIFSIKYSFNNKSYHQVETGNPANFYPGYENKLNSAFCGKLLN